MHENLLEKFRKMSNIDVKLMNKLQYGEHEAEMRKMQKILTSNPIF